MAGSSNKLPLGYESLKSVMASMSFEMREKIERHMPDFRVINTVVPYMYDYACVLDNRIWRLNNCIWAMEYKQWENMDRVRYYDERDDFDEDGVRRVKYDRDWEEEKNLALKYIRDGTKIRHLIFAGLPKCLEKESIKIIVAELTLSYGASLTKKNVAQFEKIAPFLKHPLDKFEMHIKGESVALLDHPLVHSCKELSLGGTCYRRFADLLPHFGPNLTHLTLSFYPDWHLEHGEFRYQFGVSFARDLTQHWLSNGTPIGSTFTSPTDDYFFIYDVFDMLCDDFNARKSKIANLGFDFFAHCFIVPFNETSEIVAYAIRYKKKYVSRDVDYALRIEVKPIGAVETSELVE